MLDGVSHVLWLPGLARGGDCSTFILILKTHLDFKLGNALACKTLIHMELSPMPKTIAPNRQKASIEISYRDDGNGKGPFWDHYTIRRVSQHNTVISKANDVSTDAFQSENHTNTHRLDMNNDTEYSAFPEIKNTQDICGLLMIPGEARDIKSKRPNAYQKRLQHETQLIKQALLQGRPILAICAGSWRLWQTQIAPNIPPGKVEAVSGHAYSSMPRILKSGKLGYNKQIHRIAIEPHSILAGAMGIPTNEVTTTQPTVNSVHWNAVDATTPHPLFQPVARSVRDEKIEPKNRQGNAMDPKTGGIEAYESKFGAPQLGIQWHPEAYNASDITDLTPELHINLILYMALAGDAFHAKQLMLTELENFPRFKACATAVDEVGETQAIRPSIA
jgi:gamma-glutamyl-gamma-aminobutyrate hydrolase PuuD